MKHSDQFRPWGKGVAERLAAKLDNELEERLAEAIAQRYVDGLADGYAKHYLKLAEEESKRNDEWGKKLRGD